MDSVHNADQPLTSVEFNCGDCNFGERFTGRTDPSATDFKARMCIAQGNRMLNYYLFTGGINYRMDEKRNDGNDRIAFTGGRHGFAAPINPEGEYNFTYPRMVRGAKAIMAVADKAAVMNEEHDDVAFAFIPDYYMTEYRYPKSEKMNEILRNIEANRTSESWEVMGRSMLLAGYRFTAVDIQNKPVSEWGVSVLALPSARYMDSSIQKKLADYMQAGGGILLYGEVPQFDMEGKNCTILADAMGVKVKGYHRDSQFYYLSVYADGWAAPRPEVRTSFAQAFEIGNAEPLMRVYGTDDICSFDAKAGKGRAIVISHPYRCDIELIKTALEKLGAKAALYHDYKHHGIFMTSTASESGESLLHILNLDGLDKEFYVYKDGNKLFDGRKILLQNKDGVMLPLNVSYNNVKIVYSTAEIMKVEENSIEFRLTQAEDVIALETERNILPSSDYHIKTEGNKTLVISNKHAKVNDFLIINFV
jgi:beta-galactosidase